MADDVLASLRPEGGWWTTTGRAAATSSTSPPVEAQVDPPRGPLLGDERWLLTCIDRGHVRWAGQDTRRVATRFCAHTLEHADITDRVAGLIKAGHAQRTGSSGGLVQLTTDGRRRLADLERTADG